MQARDRSRGNRPAGARALSETVLLRLCGIPVRPPAAGGDHYPSGAVARPWLQPPGPVREQSRGRMRISIIMLTLDSPRYFDEAVGTIEREGNVELEHIVVHDGDETFIDGLRRRCP